MDLYRIIVYNISKIKDEDGYYIDNHEDNYFPDEYQDITYVKSEIIDDIQYLFLLSDDYKINKLVNLLNGRLIFKLDNITDQFIRCKQIDGIDIVKNKKFFDDFKLNHLTIDNILDKINECGIDLLDKIDLIILNKNGS